MSTQYKESSMPVDNPIVLDEHVMRHGRIRYSIPSNPKLVGYIRRNNPYRIEDIYMDPMTGRHYMRSDVTDDNVKWIPLGTLWNGRIYINDEPFELHLN